MATTAKKAATNAPKKSASASKATVSKTPEPKVEAPPASEAVAKVAAAKPAAPKVQPKAESKVKESKKREEVPYATALAEYRDLKKGVSDDFARLCYDARLKEPKNSKTPEEATAKVEAVVAAYREFARVLDAAAPKRP